MITDHPYLAAVIFGIVFAALGFSLGAWFRKIEVRRLRQANETLRMMLYGVPFDDRPPRYGRRYEQAEQRTHAWWIKRRAKLKSERNSWPNYSPSKRRT